MKNRFFVLSALLGMAFLLVSLPKNAGADSQDSTPVPEKFRAQITSVVKSYLEVKDALGHSDFEAASEAVGALEESINKLDASLLPEASRSDLKERMKILKENASGIKSASDIKAQREALLVLSEQLGYLGKQYGPLSLTLYRQFCPMAFGEGGQWLSDSREILNPYYGADMPKCGEVVETIEGVKK